MCEVVFAVGDNEIGVCHSVVTVGRSRLCGDRNARGPLDRLDRRFRSREPTETPVEQIQPASQHGRRIARGIGGHEDELDLIRNRGGPENLRWNADNARSSGMAEDSRLAPAAADTDYLSPGFWSGLAARHRRVRAAPRRQAICRTGASGRSGWKRAGGHKAAGRAGPGGDLRRMELSCGRNRIAGPISRRGGIDLSIRSNESKTSCRRLQDVDRGALHRPRSIPWKDCHRRAPVGRRRIFVGCRPS
jgi:hypothetical protein